MSGKKGPIILFLIVVLFVLLGYFGKDILFKEKLKSTSDSSVDAITVNWAGDSYLGYAFLQTIEMKKQLAKKGIALNFTNDNGDYAARLQNFNDNKYDFIVLPVNSYLEHGQKYKYPGVISAVICESKGADAIVGFADVLSEGKINQLNNPNLKILYTPGSPSSFLLDLTISDFDLDELKKSKNWRIEKNGSEEIYKIAKNALSDRTLGDAFVLWEPDVTKSIEQLGLKKLWGSDKFRGYIIDVIVCHRDFVQKHPEKINDLLTTYFRVLNYYTSRDKEMIEEFSKITGIDDEDVEKMIPNIDWYSLQENCTNMFDIPVASGMSSRDGLINTIYACSDVMNRSGSLSENVNDPYLLINSTFIQSIKDQEITSSNTTETGQKYTFTQLSDNEWSKLNEVGTIRVEPITFQSGAQILDFQGEEIVDKVAIMLVNNYPNYRIAIKGHTGQGDESENLKLSKGRADVVKQRLVAVHGVNPDRLYAIGLGSSVPPKKITGENPRAFMLRWARVEFVLLENPSL